MTSNCSIFSGSILLLATLIGGCKEDGGTAPGDESTGTSDSTTTSTTTFPLTTDPSTSSTSSSSTTEDPSSSSTTEEASSSSSSSGGILDGVPDIDMTLVVGSMSASVFTDTETFNKNSCSLEEECVSGTGERRLLHFSTITPNVGEGDFVVGSPDLNPELFEFGACHNHWHFKDFANYRLLDAEMNVVATGHKMSFALIDLQQYDPDAGPGKYPLNDGTQGITVGWADVYMWGLDCQWVDITDVPPGDYTLEVSINPEQIIEELSYDNNIASIPVTITDTDTGMPTAPKTWTCDPDYYGTFDGCDCGCGEFDPDCMNPTVDACQYCDNPGSCAEDLNCDAISDNDNSQCD